MIKALTALEDQHRSIIKWLSPINPDTIRTKISNNRVKGSGTWLLNTEVFQNWTQSDKSLILWLNGISQH